MRSFSTIVLASAVLSASVFAGLAFADVSTGAAAPSVMDLATPTVVGAAPALSGPSSRTCTQDAWPYRQAACPDASDRDGAARRVRVIRIDGRTDATAEPPDAKTVSTAAKAPLANARGAAAPARR